MFAVLTPTSPDFRLFTLPNILCGFHFVFPPSEQFPRLPTDRGTELTPSPVQPSRRGLRNAPQLTSSAAPHCCWLQPSTSSSRCPSWSNSDRGTSSPGPRMASWPKVPIRCKIAALSPRSGCWKGLQYQRCLGSSTDVPVLSFYTIVNLLPLLH